MELVKGICFFCSNGKVISDSKNVRKIIISLFDKSNVNDVELEQIDPPKVCPMCYYKIVLLKKILKDISSSNKDSTDSSFEGNCLLCGSPKEVIKFSKWNEFDKISKDYSILSGPNPSVCSACVFYLDTRNFVKEKLVSVYPKLKRIEKIAPKFGSDVTHHSTPIVERRTRTKAERKTPTIIDLTSETEEKNPLLLSPKLQPLKDSDLKISKMVHDDPKFMNQILIVKLNSLNESLEKATNIINSERTIKRVKFEDEISDEDKLVTTRRIKIKEIRKAEVLDHFPKSTPNKLKIKEVKEKIDEAPKKLRIKEIKPVEEMPKKLKIKEIKPPKTDLPAEDEDSSSNQVDLNEWESRADSPDPRKKSFFKIKLTKKKPKLIKKDSPSKPTEEEPRNNLALKQFQNQLKILLERMEVPEKEKHSETVEIESEGELDPLSNDCDPKRTPTRKRKASRTKKVQTTEKMDTDDNTCVTKNNSEQTVTELNGHIEEEENGDDDQNQTAEMEELDKSTEAKSANIKDTSVEVENNSADVENNSSEVEDNSGDLKAKSPGLEEKSAEVEEKSDELDEKSAELEEKSAELEEKSAELEEKSAELEEKSVELKEKSAEVENNSEQDNKADDTEDVESKLSPVKDDEENLKGDESQDDETQDDTQDDETQEGENSKDQQEENSELNENETSCEKISDNDTQEDENEGEKEISGVENETHDTPNESKVEESTESDDKTEGAEELNENGDATEDLCTKPSNDETEELEANTEDSNNDESVLADNSQTVSDLDKDEDGNDEAVITLDTDTDNSQEKEDNVPGKRKRTDSNSDATDTSERKKKKVTFCDDVVETD